VRFGGGGDRTIWLRNIQEKTKNKKGEKQQSFSIQNK
jgi:hypothetical protein